MKTFKLYFKREVHFPCTESAPFIYAKDKAEAKKLAKLEFAPAYKHILGYVEVKDSNGKDKEHARG